MAVWLFTEAVLEGRPVKLFNHGKMRRDFTYVDDVTESVVRLIARPPRGDPEWSGQSPNPSSSPAPWRIYNIGNNHPVELEHLLAVIEAATGRTAVRELEPIQPGDVMETYADIADLAAAVDFAPRTAIEDGVTRFVNWYRAYTRRQT